MSDEPFLDHICFDKAIWNSASWGEIVLFGGFV